VAQQNKRRKKQVHALKFLDRKRGQREGGNSTISLPNQTSMCTDHQIQISLSNPEVDSPLAQPTKEQKE
jgi:hypothetical protein